MKIVVFAPHPDDEIFGCGGSILKWLEEGHDVHIVYVTDNRVLIAWGLGHDVLLLEEAEEFINLSEDEIAKIALKEAEQVSQDFGLKRENVHLFKFHDQDAMNNIEAGVTLAKQIIKDADRIVLSSDNNNHVDHQATHTIAKRAAKELNLRKSEFYVYALYNVLKSPKEKQIKIKMEQYRKKLYELMKGYKTQLCLKDTRLGWEYVLKRKRFERFGVFRFEDMNKFENF
ncbi:MAG: PIG-L deacetylase family protein [Candidatus Hodarchaeota archaeon]